MLIFMKAHSAREDLDRVGPARRLLRHVYRAQGQADHLPDPDSASCDGPQSLSPAEFAALTTVLRTVAEQTESVGRGVG